MVKQTKRIIILLVVVGLCLIALATWPLISQVRADEATPYDWRGDWAVAEGFGLNIDTEGYHLPTAIAFVPEPGPGPKDPLYFVTELRGRVKVVTNDRSIYTFAQDFFQLQPEKELPEVEGETGLAGICLAPEQGYVFVTFAHQDEEGILRNNVVRFESKPHTFSLEPAGQLAFTSLFSGYESAISHQIGSCQVVDESLYVSVGDGRQTEESQHVDSLLGKILRLSLDGQPVANNPYYDAGDAQTAADFVWAYGLRNPFGLKAVGDRLFVVDNGSDIDRFLEVQAGENYLWDGSDWSIGARADVALSPDIGPAQLEFNPTGSALLPSEFDQSFFIAASKPEVTGVLSLKYSVDKKNASGVPQYILRYQGADRQILSGVALGPDGLYFVPILPNVEGRSVIYKLVYEPDQQHPFLISDGTEPLTLMWEKGCFGCHQLEDEGGTAGPELNQQPMVERLNTMLNSEEYLQTLQEVDRLDREPFRSFKAARGEVLQAEGRERLRTWMIYHIMEPRFDNPNSQMPNMGLTKAEATVITDYLLQEKSFLERGTDAVMQFLPPVLMPRHLLFAFGIGLIAGVLVLVIVMAVVKKMERHERSKGSG